mmetsp:Transcript_892/g.1660  ORF Transcript_892/g.1660 Transcript_892/m.1660 type:complete len:203 (-) Transcript_892:889-1497(-)
MSFQTGFELSTKDSILDEVVVNKWSSRNSNSVQFGMEKKSHSFFVESTGLEVNEEDDVLLNSKRSQTEFDFRQCPVSRRRRGQMYGSNSKLGDDEDKVKQMNDLFLKWNTFSSPNSRKLLRISDEGIPISSSSSKSDTRSATRGTDSNEITHEEDYQPLSMRFCPERVYSASFPRRLSTIREDSFEKEAAAEEEDKNPADCK